MLNAVEHVLCKVIRTSRAHTVSETEMQSSVYTEAAQDTFLQSLLSSMEIIVPIAKRAVKMMNRAVNEYHVFHMEEASTAVASTEQMTGHSLPQLTVGSSVPCSFELHEEPFLAVLAVGARHHVNFREKSI